MVGAIQAHAGPVTGLSFAPDADLRFVSSGDGLVYRWRLDVNCPRCDDPHAERSSRLH